MVRVQDAVKRIEVVEGIGAVCCCCGGGDGVLHIDDGDTNDEVHSEERFRRGDGANGADGCRSR